MWILASCLTANNSTQSIARDVIAKHRIIYIYITPHCRRSVTQMYSLKGILPFLSMSTKFPPSKT